MASTTSSVTQQKIESTKRLWQQLAQLSGATLISRVLGVIRETLQIKYLGISPLSDAFIAAVGVPTSLRKLFADGALSGLLVPKFMHAARQSSDTASQRTAINRLLSTSLLLFQVVVLLLVIGLSIGSTSFVSILVPGFTQDTQGYTAVFLRLLLPFIVFISGSAVFAAALNTVGHFFIPAIGQVILNIFYIAGLLLCLQYQLPVWVLCCSIVFGAIIQLLTHVVMYYHLGFRIQPVTRADLWAHIPVLLQFLVILPTRGVQEIGFYVDKFFASFIPNAVSHIYYATRFMQIPLGVFAVSFANVLLPRFASVYAHNPSRLAWYLTHAIMTVLWIMLPLTVLMWCCAHQLFTTLFIHELGVEHVHTVARTFQVLVLGLPCFALNGVLSNALYAMHAVWLPGIIAAVSTISNIIGNALFMRYGVVGLAVSTTLSGVLHTIMLLAALLFRQRCIPYMRLLKTFIGRYIYQLSVVSVPLYGMYIMSMLMLSYVPDFLAHTLLQGIGFWCWVGPLCISGAAIVYITKKRFGISIYYLG